MARSKSTNYTRNKSLFGGVPGTIQIHTVPGLGTNNDPTTAVFKDNLPGGFLKCDGSVLNVKEYYLLAQILGIGSECRFKKENTILRDPDPTTGDLGSFQLPDLGSKVMIPSGGSGEYTNVFMENKPNVRKVGVECEASLQNEGNRINVNYTSGSTSNNGITAWSGYNGSVGGGGAITGFIMRQVTDSDGASPAPAPWSGTEFGSIGYRNAPGNNQTWWTGPNDSITGDYNVRVRGNTSDGLGAVMNITIEPNVRPSGEYNRSKIRVNSYVNGQRGSGYAVDDECSVSRWDELEGTGNRIFRVTSISEPIESEGFKLGTTDAWYYSNVGSVYYDQVGDPQYSANDYWENNSDFVEQNFQMNGGSGAGAVFKIRMQADEGGRTKWKVLAIINPGEGYAAGDQLSWNFNTPWRIANGHNDTVSLFEEVNGGPTSNGVIKVNSTSVGSLEAGMEVEGSLVDLEFGGNIKYNVVKETEPYILTMDEFQAHSHSVDMTVLNYTGNYDVSGLGMTGDPNTAMSANCEGYNSIVESSINVPVGQPNHSHTIVPPSAYNENFVYNFAPFNISTDGMQSYVDVDTTRLDVLNQVVTPFIMVHYIIKF
jgi:hypothetical protein